MKASIEWQIATVKAVHPETHSVKTLTLKLPNWQRHRPGQHYDIRLTAEDGYQAQRSYSIASEPEREGEIDLTVERIESGEVSPYLHDVLIPGDRIEVRGPIGGYFVWEGSRPEPLLLIAGGSGVVPLMSMLRHRSVAGGKIQTRLLYSSRTFDDIIYFAELERLQGVKNGPKVYHTLTRTQPEGWKGYARRIDRQMLGEVAKPLGGSVQVFICGPTLLVESTADELVGLGIPAAQIRTERFGPSGPA
ncbi:MAG TPA: ferredoxin reductase [Desulfomonilaceae bacterium]|nr:ferredoxin reductase [Desulfomonilaceae bacterium]